jgi:cobalamin biosynthesis Co2+ chelatase CbiK
MAVEITAIVIAYNGSTHPDASKAYDKLETHVRAKYPDAAIRRVFTSETLLEKIAGQDDQVDSLAGALEKLAVEKHRNAAVLPGMVFAGETYVMMMPPLMVFGEVFSEGVSLFRTLLDWEADCRMFAKAFLAEIATELDQHDALVLLAHSNHPAIEILERELKKLHDNVLITTLEELPDFTVLRNQISAGKFKKVLIHPLMIACGRHVHRDMGEKMVTTLEADNLKCTPILKGLCEYDSICKLLANHIIPSE